MPTSMVDKNLAILENSDNNNQMLQWLISIALPLGLMLIPTTEVFTHQVRLFLAGTLFAILLFAFELLPQLIPALFLPIFYVISNVAPSTAVFSPWSTNIPWMFLGGILLANCLESVGLLRRIAYWCIIKTGGTYKGILYGVMFAGIILNILIPAQAVIPMAAFTYGICKALNLGKSKESAGIMLTGAFAALLPLFFFFNPNFAIITGVASSVHPMKVTWAQYFIQNIPNILWCFLMVFIVSKVFKPSQPIDCKDYFAEEFSKLGRLTTNEKKALFVTALLVIFLVTGGIHGIEIGWGFALAAMLLFVPGINIGTESDIKRVNYSLLFFVTACMSIGAVANVLGLGKIIAQTLLPLMSSNGIFVTLSLVWLLCVVSNFLLTPLAIMAAFTVPLTEIALKLGIDPMAFHYTIFQGCDQIIMPYEYALVLIFFSFGLIHLKDFIKIFSIKMALNLVFLLLVLVPYWKLIGLL